MNKIMTIALLGVLLTTGAIQAEASEQTVSNVTVSWHGNRDYPNANIDFDFEIIASGWQNIHVTVDGKDEGTMRLYGKTGLFYDGKYRDFTISDFFSRNQPHVVCVNGTCVTLPSG